MPFRTSCNLTYYISDRYFEISSIIEIIYAYMHIFQNANSVMQIIHAYMYETTILYDLGELFEAYSYIAIRIKHQMCVIPASIYIIYNVIS